MEELTIYKYKAITIENALRLAMNVLDSRNKSTETAMDRELLLADKYIKEVLKSAKW
jgi:predicted transcriptional regulator